MATESGAADDEHGQELVWTPRGLPSAQAPALSLAPASPAEIVSSHEYSSYSSVARRNFYTKYQSRMKLPG
jgi:hypothetical protein